MSDPISLEAAIAVGSTLPRRADDFSAADRAFRSKWINVQFGLEHSCCIRLAEQNCKVTATPPGCRVTCSGIGPGCSLEESLKLAADDASPFPVTDFESEVLGATASDDFDT